MLHISEQSEFEYAIIQKVQTSQCSYIDAMIEYCEEHELEPEAVSTWVTKSLKEKLRIEAEALHMLSRSPSLPFSS